MESRGFIGALLLGTVLFTQGQLEAGLIVSSEALVASETNDTATVNVRLYGGVSGPNPIELVSSFGVKVTLTGVTATIISPSLAPVTSDWSAFNNRPTPITTANSVTFQGYKTPLSAPHVTITGAVPQPSTLIGVFSFTVNKLNSPQDFTTTVSADTALGEGNVPVGTGFLFQDTGFLADIPTTYNPSGSNRSGTIAAIAVVPEPTCLMLVAFAALGAVQLSKRP